MEIQVNVTSPLPLMVRADGVSPRSWAVTETGRVIITHGNDVTLEFSSKENGFPPCPKNGHFEFPSELPETASRYRILRRLGKGGMGTVYLGLDTWLNKDVALKFLSCSKGENSQLRILGEAHSAAAIDHPFVCMIHNIGITGDQEAFLVMEYVDGHLLREEIEKGALSLARLLPLAWEIADGLEAAHAKGVVHCDLKPENIMLTKQGHVKITDFGLARRCLQGPYSELEKGSLAQGWGTWKYMAPEQLRGEAEIDHRVDLFAFGTLLFESLTGIHPFRKENFVLTALAILNEAPLQITELRSDVPALLKETIERLLEKHPAQRYQTIRPAKENLGRLLQELKPVETVTRRRICRSLTSLLR